MDVPFGSIATLADPAASPAIGEVSTGIRKPLQWRVYADTLGRWLASLGFMRASHTGFFDLADFF
jgi:hypothetical protein